MDSFKNCILSGRYARWILYRENQNGGPTAYCYVDCTTRVTVFVYGPRPERGVRVFPKDGQRGHGWLTISRYLEIKNVSAIMAAYLDDLEIGSD